GLAATLAQSVLDFLRRYFLAPAKDQVLDAGGNPEVAVGIHARFVARMQPAVGVDGGARRLGAVVVARHHVVPAAAQLAALAGRALGAGGRIDNLHLELGKRRTDGRGAPPDRRRAASS